MECPDSHSFWDDDDDVFGIFWSALCVVVGSSIQLFVDIMLLHLFAACSVADRLTSVRIINF